MASRTALISLILPEAQAGTHSDAQEIFGGNCLHQRGSHTRIVKAVCRESAVWR